MNNNHWNDSTVESIRATTLYVFLAAAFGIWLAWDAAFYRLVLYAAYADYWEHTALLTEWVRNFADPANPHVADPSLSSRYMPLFWVLTWVGVTFGLNSVELMGISAVVNYVLIVIGLHVFLRSYFRDPWAPAVGFIVIFFFWGVSWNWSNLYHLRSFFYIAGFPSTFVFALSLFAFALVPKILRKDGSGLILGVGLCLLSALMFVCHPLTGVFGIGGCAVLAITEASVSWRQRFLVLAALGLGALAAELWPYFSVWKVSLGLYGAGEEQWFSSGEAFDPLARYRSGVWRHIFYNPRLILIMLGPALLGIPILFWLLIRRQHLFIVLGAFSMALPYGLHLFVEVPLAHRFLLFVVTYLHLAIIWGILRVIDSWSLSPRPPRAGFWLASVLTGMGVLVVINVALLSLEFGGQTLTPKTLEIVEKGKNLPDGFDVVDVYTRLTDPLPEDAIVLSTPVTGWPLPTVKGKVVSVYHENPLLLDQAERYVATERFFAEPLSEAERSAVIRQYAPGYLLLEGEPATAQLQSWLARHARQIAGVGSFRMYRLLDTADDALAPKPLVVESVSESAGPGPIAETLPSVERLPEPELDGVKQEQPEAEEPIGNDGGKDLDEQAQPPAFGAPISNSVAD